MSSSSGGGRGDIKYEIGMCYIPDLQLSEQPLHVHSGSSSLGSMSFSHSAMSPCHHVAALSEYLPSSPRPLKVRCPELDLTQAGDNDVESCPCFSCSLPLTVEPEDSKPEISVFGLSNMPFYLLGQNTLISHWGITFPFF